MIIERTMDRSWLSNSYLVADQPGGHAVVIDTGGPLEPLVAQVRALGVSVEHILCTHHHHDHIAHNADWRRLFGSTVCGHASERALFDHLDRTLEHGEELLVGTLRIRALHIPGHTVGQLAYVVNDERVFTGDTLFAGSVGGTRAPGHTTFEDIRHSIMEILMALPHAMTAHPGHTEATTIGGEWEGNPFIRAWRGLDPVVEQPCTAFGEPATLLLSARDYDGGTKCWVRFEAGGKLDIVPGSRVATAGA